MITYFTYLPSQKCTNTFAPDCKYRAVYVLDVMYLIKARFLITKIQSFIAIYFMANLT